MTPSLLIAKVRRRLVRRDTPRSNRSRQEGMDDAVRRARAAIRARDWPAAAELWQEVLELGGSRAPDVAWEGLSRAARAQGNWQTAAETIARGRATHPDSVALVIEDGRIALHGHRRTTEDEQFAWKQRLLEIETRLLELRSAGVESPQLLTTLGDVSIALRHWALATEVWETVEGRYPARAGTAAIRQSQAHRLAGDLTSARAALDRVSGPTATSKLYQEEVRRLGSQLGRWASDESAHHARWRLVLGDLEAGERLLRGALLVRGLDEGQIDALGSVTEALVRIAADRGEETSGGGRFADREPGTGSSSLTPRRVLHVSGFLYSGSGAVFDHLRSLPGAHLPFDGRETGFLKKPGNLAQLLDTTARDPQTLPAEVIEVILASVFGVGQTGRPLLGYFVRQPESIEKFSAAAVRLVGRLDHLGRAARGANGLVEVADAAQAVRRFLDEVLIVLTPPGATAIINNAIIAHQLNRLDLFGDARAVAVVRDPRDQYVSQAHESPNAMGCDDFIAMMRERYEAFGRVRGSHGDRILAVRFEDYVDDSVTRSGLLEALGFDESSAREGHGPFDPERSRRNIGIHRRHPDRAEVARVDRALRGYYEQAGR